MSASFVSPDVIRRLFAQAMSRMYRTEVPLYGTLVELVERINAQVLAQDPALAAQLSRLLSRGRAAAVGEQRVRGWSALAHGVVVDFPVTVYRTWRWSVGTAVASIGVSVLMWLWLRAHPERIGKVLPDDQVHQLVDKDFADYYSAHPAQSFAAQVWTKTMAEQPFVSRSVSITCCNSSRCATLVPGAMLEAG